MNKISGGIEICEKCGATWPSSNLDLACVACLECDEHIDPDRQPQICDRCVNDAREAHLEDDT